MTLLFITPSFPSRLHRIRSWQLIESLSKRHSVHLLSLAFEPIPTHDLEALKNVCSSVTIVRKSKWHGVLDVLFRLPLFEPFEISYCHSSSMRRVAKEIISRERIQCVYVKRLRSTQFVTNLTTPTVLDSTDAMSMFYGRARKNVSMWLKPLYYHEWFTYKNYEKKLAKQFTSWVVCSDIDGAYLRKLLPKTVTISIIPNGVDTEFYTQANTTPNQKTLIITGLFTKFVNIEAALYFIRDILPYVAKSSPEVQLLLVGPAHKKIKELSTPHITVTGEVPDIRPYIAMAQVVCVPVLTGSGTRNKILQAWSIGRPVISTPQGSEGLEGVHGRDLLIANTALEFASSISTILNNPNTSEQLVLGGKRLINEKYSMHVIGAKLDTLLTTITHHG